MDKQQLRSIMLNQYQLPSGMEKFEAVQQVVSIIGSTDPEVRDELGYSILYHWLITNQWLSTDQLNQLLHQTLSDSMLFFEVEAHDCDSVFQRSFSALLLALLLNRDLHQPFINQHLFEQITNRVIEYCHREHDYRDYIEDKGWAHAPAHIADVITACVRSSYVGPENCKELLGAIEHMLLHAPELFRADEDERMATAIVAMIEANKVTLSGLCSWLMQIELPDDRSEAIRYRRLNCKHLARSIWMRAAMKGLVNPSTEWQLWREVEKKLNPTFNKN